MCACFEYGVTIRQYRVNHAFFVTSPNLALATNGTTKALPRHPNVRQSQLYIATSSKATSCVSSNPFHANIHHRHLPLSSPDNYAMTNRAYFYHLRFELFPKPPTTFVDKTAPDVDHETRLPSTPVSFSDSLPNHFKLPVAKDNQRATTSKHVDETARRTTDVADALNNPTTGRRGSVIDCGPQRADIPRNPAPRDTEPSPISRRSVEEAARDWRFGRVRASSIQMGEPPGKAAEGMGGAGSGVKSQGMRARVEEVRLRGREEELGWGVVHLYREGEETGGLGEVVEEDGSGGKEVGEVEGADTTMLCIPAVPSYMTASDFLGWVGERTREQVSHFRMVMTGRMNRYMMLMKFRDGGEARRWRREWDGKVFNGMEVSCEPAHLVPGPATDCFVYSPKTAMSCSSNRSTTTPSPPRTKPTPQPPSPTCPSTPSPLPTPPSHPTPTPHPSPSSPSRPQPPPSSNFPPAPSASSAWTKQPASSPFSANTSSIAPVSKNGAAPAVLCVATSSPQTR